MVKDEPKLSRFEILGAWLNVWTPPRDAHVPPVPWRTIGIWTPIVLVALGVAAAIFVPQLDEAKSQRAAEQRRQLETRAAARRERVRAEQVARVGRVRPDLARGQVMADVERVIGVDARERFNPRARSATCEPAPGQDEGGRRVAYDCVSAIRDIVGAGDQEGARGVLGIPFRAVVDWDRHAYAFCKVNPPPGEQVIPDPRDIVQLPRACRG
jgi:hypothetical protein